jgi:hypothetical protein
MPAASEPMGLSASNPAIRGGTQLLPEVSAGKQSPATASKDDSTFSRTASEMLPKVNRGPRAVLLVGGAAALVVVVALALRPSPAPTPTTDPPAAATTTTTSATPTTAPGKSTTASVTATASSVPGTTSPPHPVNQGGANASHPARVTLDVSSSPPESRVVNVDTKELLGLTPLHQQVPRGTGSLEIRIEKSGYVPKTASIPLGRDFKGSFQLEKRKAIIKL